MLREGRGNCLKYLKSGWNRKEGRGNKDFKKGGQAGSRGGCLIKRGLEGLEPPYKLYIYIYSSVKNAINANCLIIDDPLLLCNKDSQGIMINI